MNMTLGQEIRGYTIEKRIGAGGFGEVYSAYQATLKRRVALKVILPQYANDPDFVRRFETEAHLVAQLEHPHIVPLYDYWRSADDTVLVMRYVEAGSLLEAIEAQRLTDNLRLQYLEHIATALALAHSRSIIHRDIKPANMLIDERHNAYLTDFGIAFVQGQESDHAENRIVGTFQYIAPEQLRGEAVTPLSDQYALGIVAYQTLTGRLPFEGASVSQLIYQQIHEPLPSLSHHRGDLSASVNDVIQRATAKNAWERYEDVLSFVADLRQALFPTTNSSQVRQRLIAASRVNPYRGLATFEVGDAPFFYGRQAVIQMLLKRLNEDSPDARFLALVGASGSGKSSLLKAGILNALRQGAIEGSERWYIAEMRPTDDPFVPLAESLRAVTASPLTNVEQVLRQSNAGLWQSVAQALPQAQDTLVLAIDQFEELFTQVQDAQVTRQFLDLLYHAVTAPHSQVIVLVALRADFFDRPLLMNPFGRLLADRHHALSALTSQELQEVIVKPAEQVGVEIDSALVAHLMSDAGEQAGALPLLQYTLAQLFEHKQDAERIRLSDYQQMGGLRGAISKRADEVYLSLDEQQQGLAQQAFLRLVTLGEGTEDTRRRARYTELLSLGGEALMDVVRQFEVARLISSDVDVQTREPLKEVAHEALIREWGRLRAWLDSTRDDLRQERNLSQLAHDWQAAQQNPSFLLRGERLASFSAWAQSTRILLPQSAQTFLHASQSAHETQMMQERQRAERELALEAQARNRLRWLVGVLLLAVLGTLSLALFALNQRNDAQAERNIANQERLLAEQERQRAEEQVRATTSLNLAQQARSALVEGNPFQALALALAATRTDAQQAEAQRTLAQMIDETRAVRVLQGHRERVWGADISPDGRYALSGSQDASLRLWDMATGALIQAYTGHEAGKRVYSVAFSPNGQTALSGSEDTSAILWDIASGDIVYRWQGHADLIWDVDISPDGRLGASVGQDGRINLWDLQTGEAYARFEMAGVVLLTVAFSPDSQQVLVGGTDGVVSAWDIPSGQIVQRYEGHTGAWVTGIAIAANGRMVSVASDDIVIAWRLDDSQALQRMNLGGEGHQTGPLRTVAISSDGLRALSGAYDAKIVEWDLQKGEVIRSYRGHRDWILALAISPDDRYALSASGDSTLIIWDLLGRNFQLERQPYDEAIQAVALNPNAQAPYQRLVASQTGQVWLYDGQGQEIARFDAGSNLLCALFSPNGEQIITCGQSGDLSVWSSTTYERLNRYAVGAPIWTAAFSPDGRVLAAGFGHLSASQTRPIQNGVRWWDVATGEVLAEETEFEAPVRALLFDAEGEVLYVASDDASLGAWQVATGERRWHGRMADAIRTLAFSPEGNLLSGGAEPIIAIWDAQQGKRLGQIDVGRPYVRQLYLTAEGQLLSVAGVRAEGIPEVALWDWQSRQIVRRFIGHQDAVSALALDERQARLYSAGMDAQVITWRLESLSALTDWVYQAFDVACLPTLSEQDSRCKPLSFMQAPSAEAPRQQSIPRQTAGVLGECAFPEVDAPAPEQIDTQAYGLNPQAAIRVGFSHVGQAEWAQSLAQNVRAQGWRWQDLGAESVQVQSDAWQSALGQVDVLLIYPADYAQQVEALNALESSQTLIILLNVPRSASAGQDEQIVQPRWLQIGIDEYLQGCVSAQELLAVLNGEGMMMYIMEDTSGAAGRWHEAGVLNVIDRYPEISQPANQGLGSPEGLQIYLNQWFGVQRRPDVLLVQSEWMAQVAIEDLRQKAIAYMPMIAPYSPALQALWEQYAIPYVAIAPDQEATAEQVIQLIRQAAQGQAQRFSAMPLQVERGN